MKKIALPLLFTLLILSAAGCKSSPDIYLPAPVNVVNYKNVYIDVIYDPLLLMTIEDKKGIIEDLTTYINAMGFRVGTESEDADMILRITIDELILSERNKRLFARTSLGLAEGESLMKYTASFIDGNTFEEIIASEGEMKTKLFFPSREEVKKKFFSQMREEIIDFMTQNKVF